MTTKKTISILLILTMICSMFMSAVPVSAADIHCAESDCIVCEVADLINALPDAEDITIDNAATVTDRIHAIDRIKYDLTDEEYDELLTLVDTGANEAGAGLGVPVRYMNAVEAINAIGGGSWFVVAKKFVAADGAEVDVTDAEVQIEITNTATDEAVDLTLATLGTQTSALGADYYTENADGWTYKYLLPAGTYKIAEVSDSGATVDGEAFVTGSVSYNGETGESITVTLNEGDNTAITISNSYTPEHTHAICGESTCGTDHDLDGTVDGLEAIVWTELTQEMVDANTGTSEVKLATGNYYLASDIDLGTRRLTSDGTYSLCLNGFTLTSSTTSKGTCFADSGDVFNITSCNNENEGSVICTGSSTAGIKVESGGKLNIYGGTIKGNWEGVYVYGGTASMYGGSIIEPRAYGAVHLVSNSKFYLYDGYLDTYELMDCSILLNTVSVDCKAFVYGGEMAGAIEAGGEVHIKNAPVVSKIEVTNHYEASYGTFKIPLVIDGKLTNTSPIEIEVDDVAYDFTDGWSDHMSDADASEYFTYSGNSNLVAVVNEESGELHFVNKTIRVNASNASVKVSDWVAAEGDNVDMTIIPNEGYYIDYIYAMDISYTNVVLNDNGDGNYSLTMGAPVVTVNATVKKIPHNITVTEGIVGATVTPNVTTAGIDDKVELTITPDHGYKLESLTVTDADGSAVETTKVGEDDTKYTFTMPNSAVTVNATFKHCHPVCGAACDGDCGVEAGQHGDMDWTAITQEMVTNNSEAAVALTAGNYYLATDITLGEHYFTTTGTVNICLNGNTMSTTSGSYCIKLESDTAVVNLTDCGTTGKVDAASGIMSYALHLSNGSAANIYGGTYDGNWATAYVGTNSVLTLYNGTLNNTVDGKYGCVYLVDGTFWMHGGSVSSYKQIPVSISGGGNSAAYIYGGTLTADSASQFPVVDTWDGQVHIAGAPVFSGEYGHIRLSSLGQGYGLYIDGPLTGAKIEIDDAYIGYEYSDFTTGWKDHMSTAYAPDYFTYYGDSTLLAAVNEETGELRFVDESVAPKKITVAEGIENGTVEAAVAAKTGTEVALTVKPAEGYAVESVTVTDADSNVTNAVVNAEDATKYTFTMPATEATVSATFKAIDYKVNISKDFVGGTVTPDKETANIGDAITLTATPVSGYEFTSLTVTDAEGNEINTVSALAEATQLSFEMPASDVTVNAVFTKKTIENVFTVQAVVDETATTDKDTSRDGMHVESGDTVKIDVIVNGADYTNADWEIFYDFSKLEYVKSEINTAYENVGYYTADETRKDGGILKGEVSGVAGNDANADEFKNGDVIVSYYFTAKPQSKEVTAKFSFTEAHANTYEMAGIQDNTAATSGDVDVTIILITDDDGDETKTPAGSIQEAVKIYNALEQAGNEYVLDEVFADATVTYAIVDENGSAVTDTNNDGSTADEIAALPYRTGLPTWKDVGTYTYYVKISGDGLATIYDSTTLTINPATLTPSATFAVDPDVNKVTITPVLEGVLDGSHNGTVTVTYTDADGNTQTETFDAATEFDYDGEITSVYNGTPIEVAAQKSGTFTVTIDYTEGTVDTAGKADNYTGESNTASVDVDKITASIETVTKLEDAVESVSELPYDGTEHTLDINSIKIPTDISEGSWKVVSLTDAYDETNTAPSVTNVGDEVLVKVVFEDTTEKYNDIVVYVVLKVIPAEVRITIADHKKAVGEDDPLPFGYTLEVLGEDENGNEKVLLTNALYGDDLTDLALELTREPGEAAGTYAITATYVPNANYNITVIDGKLEIGAPEMGPDGDVLIEVVDLSNTDDGTPDYIAGKRLILVYTDLDKAYYTYEGANLFDVTDAGYKYVDNVYENNALTETQYDTEYKHVYGIVVDAIDTYEATEEYEARYTSKVIFAGSDAQYAPENIVYDADINCTGVLDINDYSMADGIYNVDGKYDRATYIRSILKADYDHDKIVNSDDSLAVKAIVDEAAEEAKE